MSHFTSHAQNVGNPVQIVKYVELSKFQPIIKLKVTFGKSLFTEKPFKGVAILTNLDFWKNEGASHDFKLLIMLEYRLCCLMFAESDK